MKTDAFSAESFIVKPIADLPKSGIREFFDLVAGRSDVISLGVGEPDFPTPWQIRNTGIRSLEQGHTKYTSNAGMLQLRREIATYLKRRFDLDYEYKSQVLVTVGGSEAIDLAMRVILTPGDEVIIPEPSYVCYEPIVKLAGGVPVIINTKAENDFKVTAEELKSAITDKTKVLILPYPSNPTGAIMEREDLEALAKVLEDTNIIVLSDEIYAELTFGDASHVSIASIDGMRERTVLINGFSKTFSMTGWRLGYACGPEPILKEITKIHQYAIMCAPTTSQHAAIEALRSCEDKVREMVEEYDTRRN